MRVVTAADHKMKDWCERCVEAASKWYPVDVYDLGGLGFGIDAPTDAENLTWDNGYLPCLFKIPIVAHGLTADDAVLWLDSDCILQRNVDELLDHNTIAVAALRKEGDVGAGRINTGVMLWRKHKFSVPALATWSNLATLSRSEQKAFNAIVEHDRNNYTLVGPEYNNYYFDGSDAAIIHYKTDKRHLYEAGNPQPRP